MKLSVNADYRHHHSSSTLIHTTYQPFAMRALQGQ